MEEIWKDIPRYEGHYQVSNFGNVKSLARTVVRSDGKINHTKERILKPGVDSDGYLYVTLCTNSKYKFRRVHTLVLEAFIGPRPEGLDVCHNDGNNQNNRLDNLRYDTHSNNSIDMVKQNRQHLQKLSADDVRQIRKLLNESNLTQADIARMYNVTDVTVHDIKTRKSWTWLTE